MTITFKFGEVDAMLADLNHVASSGRSAFAARLKNLHRLGFPAGIGSGRGRAANYRVSDVIQMAIAVELSQFGILPERAVTWITEEMYAVLMAVSMGGGQALKVPDGGFEEVDPEDEGRPASMFLYFDPCSVAPWADDGITDWGGATFFYGGEGVVRENIARWTTTGFTPRLSLLNVTALLWQLSQLTPDPKGFLAEAVEWAEQETTKGDFDLDHWLGGAVADVLDAIDAGYVETMPRGLSAREIMKHLEVDFELVGLVKFFEGQGEPDLAISLPGERVLSVDFGLASETPKSRQEIADHAAYLATRPFQTMFSDNTKFTVMYVEHEDAVNALNEDRMVLADAYQRGVLIVTKQSLQELLVCAVIVWDEAKKGGHDGDR